MRRELAFNSLRSSSIPVECWLHEHAVSCVGVRSSLCTVLDEEMCKCLKLLSSNVDGRLVLGRRSALVNVVLNRKSSR